MKKTLLTLGLAILLITMSLTPALAASLSTSGSIIWEAELDLEEQPPEEASNDANPIYNALTSYPLTAMLNLDLAEDNSAVMAHIPLVFAAKLPISDTISDPDNVSEFVPMREGDILGFGLRPDATAFVSFDTAPLKISYTVNPLAEAPNLGFESFNDPLGIVTEIDHVFLKDFPGKQQYVFKASGNIEELSVLAQVIQSDRLYDAEWPNYNLLKVSTFVGSAMVSGIFADRYWIEYFDPDKYPHLSEPWLNAHHDYNYSIDANYSPAIGGVMTGQVAFSTGRINDDALRPVAKAMEFNWVDLLLGPIDFDLDFRMVEPEFEPVAATKGVFTWESDAGNYRGQQQLFAKGTYEFGDAVTKMTLTASNEYRAWSDGGAGFRDDFDGLNRLFWFTVPYNETAATLMIEQPASFLTYNLAGSYKKTLFDPANEAGSYDFNDDYKLRGFAEAAYAGTYNLKGSVEVIKENRFFAKSTTDVLESEGMGVKLFSEFSKTFSGITATANVTYVTGTYDFFGDAKDSYNGANSAGWEGFFGTPAPMKPGATLTRVDSIIDIGYAKELDDSGSKLEIRGRYDAKDLLNEDRTDRDILAVWGKLTYGLTENLTSMVSGYYGNSHKPALDADNGNKKTNKIVGYTTLKYTLSETSNILFGYSVTNYESVFGSGDFGYENHLSTDLLGNAFAEYSVVFGSSSLKFGWSENNLGPKVTLAHIDPSIDTGYDWWYPWGEISSMRGGRTDFGQLSLSITTNF